MKKKQNKTRNANNMTSIYLWITVFTTCEQSITYQQTATIG